MFFPCVAAAAAAATRSPAWFLSGAYHPPQPGRSGESFKHIAGGSDRNGDISGEALTVALDVVQAWAVLLTLGFTLIIFFFLAFCVCSKKDDGYDEFEVTQGITTVKICHDGGENGVSYIPRIAGSGTESMKATDETSEASSRYTLKRELPAIPTSAASTGPEGKEKSERPVSQHSSDLYASVNDSAQGSSSVKLIGGVQVLPAGAIAPGGRAAVVKECISSPEDQIDGGFTQKKEKIAEDQVCPPYAQIKKGHPYAQVSKTEHPYAKVASRSGSSGTEAGNYDEIKNLPKDTRKFESEPRFQSSSDIKRDEKHLPLSSHSPDTSTKDTKTGVTAVTSPHSSSIVTSCHSIVPPHTIPISSTTSPQYRSPTSPHTTEEPISIPAAMAISGRTPANEEMPYMTPPVIQPTREQTQQHFSGDSQDSRGYTSISVREPLAALKARQGEGAIAALGRNSAGKGTVQTQGSEGEGYYMTVSDDSADEMYACIYEGGSRGTGSETYAQIEPRTTPTSQAPPSVLSASSVTPSSPTGLSSSRTPQDPSPPAPPSVDSLRHVLHSRQASASSSASTGMGSPVAEKRGTRSPLPPLPQGDTILYSPPEPPILPNQPAPKSPPKSISNIMDKPTPRSLEEMYAKVLKKPHGHSRGSSSGAVEGSGDPSGGISARRGSAEIGGASMWTTTASKIAQDMSHSMVEGGRTHDVSTSVNRAKSCEVSASWGVVTGLISDDDRKIKSHYTDGRNYETIPSHLYSGSDPGYETVKNGDPPYASVDPSENYPGYETVRGSDVDSEPGYETLKQKELVEPGYETLSEVASKKSLTSEAGYESVTATDYEPGYETVSSKKSDPGYESVLEKDKVDYDPGYEVLSHPNFNRTTSETDPNYEPLKFSSRPPSQEVEIGYEVVKKDVTVEGNYELVSDYDTQMEPSEKSDKTEVIDLPSPPVPLYASVKKKENSIKEPKDLPELKKEEKINENFNILNSEILSESESKEEPIVDDSEFDISNKAVEEEKIENAVEEEMIENDQEENESDLNLADKMTAESDALINEKYPVMDSPEEVELPPPGGEDNHRVSPPVTPEENESQDMHDIISAPKPDEIIEKETVPTVSLTFTEASPPLGSPETGSTKSSSGDERSPTDSSPKTEHFEEQIDSFSTEKIESSPVDNNVEPPVDVNIPSAPPPQFSNNGSDPPPEFSNSESVPPPQFSDNESVPPPQFSNNETEPVKEVSSFINSVEDALPPPPLPVLDDDIATASPPPPPPPITDEVCGLQPDLPPPPLDKETPEEQVINGISPTSPEENLDSENYPICGASTLIEDLPPPLSSETVEPEVNVISRNGLNGSMTVTVNPMADIDDETVGSTLISVAPITVLPSTEASGEQTVISSVPPAPPIVPGGESGESQSSGSTANGSGSVESIVTVDPKRGSDPSTTVPMQLPSQDSSPPAAPANSSVILSPLQHSSSTSSSDSKHSDPNEGITPV